MLSNLLTGRKGYYSAKRLTLDYINLVSDGLSNDILLSTRNIIDLLARLRSWVTDIRVEAKYIELLTESQSLRNKFFDACLVLFSG
jgi:hypothetical protein